jgi:two-component system OmpR family sensor kinase
LLRSARVRLIAWQLVLVLVALVASTLVTREFLLARMDDRIDREIRQEVAELRALATTGVDPLTGEPFRNVGRLMRFNLQRNIPDRNETMLSLLNGHPDSRVTVEPPSRLDLDSRAVAAFAGSTDAGLRVMETDQGLVRYAAVPVSLENSTEQGVFVIAIFRDLERREVDEVVLVLALSGALALALAAGVAWIVAGRVLAPVRMVRQAADSITHTDMSQRIAVVGTDEVAELADTFNRMLDRLDEAFATQRQFVDDAGHELRTPITIIRGHLEVMGDTATDRASSLAVVNDELARMSRMVDDLLDLAKAGQPDFLRLETFDLGDLTDEIFLKCVALGERRWSMPERGDGVMVADRERVTQAVLQLAQNAVQHTAEGDEIAVASRAEQRQVQLWIADTGPGVDPADRERIFDRFARGSDRPRPSDGAGLGLSIVHSIATSHGGTVDLDPTERGATFRLTFPRAATRKEPS